MNGGTLCVSVCNPGQVPDSPVSLLLLFFFPYAQCLGGLSGCVNTSGPHYCVRCQKQAWNLLLKCKITGNYRICHTAFAVDFSKA